MSRIICLASGSQSRKRVLDRGQFNFIVKIPNITEVNDDEKADNYVKRLADEKITAIGSNVETDIIVAADSVVEFNNEILEKPKDFEDATMILRKLSGNTHTFHTGMCVIDARSKQKIISHTTTKVTFCKMKFSTIEAYVERFEPYSFAGGYENSISSWFISSIQGSQSNLMGLPMHVLKKNIEELGYHIIDFLKPKQI